MDRPMILLARVLRSTAAAPRAPSPRGPSSSAPGRRRMRSGMAPALAPGLLVGGALAGVLAGAPAPAAAQTASTASAPDPAASVPGAPAAGSRIEADRKQLDGFTHRVADVGGGVRLHYVIGGSGPPLVLLHGWPETWYAWARVMPALRAHYTVIAVDLRGFGESSRPAGGYDRRTMAADVRRLVHDVLRLGPINLAGHDWGGSTAAMYAYAYPGEVRRLAVLEALPQGPWTARDPTAREPWFYGFHRIPGLPERLTEARARDYLTWFYQNFSISPTTLTPADVDEYLRSYGAPGGMRPGFELVRNLPVDIENTRGAETRPIQVPVLAVGAERSMGAGVAANLRHMAVDVREVVVPRSHHFVLEDRPDVVGPLLLDFFAGR